MMSNGIGKETDLTKVDSISGSDGIRVIKDGSSRTILFTNFITTLTPMLSRASSIAKSTTNYLATSSNDVILMDATSGSISVTLPNAAISEGVLINIKKIDGSTNDVTVQTNGGNIDGSATATLSGSGGARPGASFISDGNNWYILNA